jgi:ATP/maltotriose-dependent transcriptional regulator MalT
VKTAVLHQVACARALLGDRQGLVQVLDALGDAVAADDRCADHARYHHVAARMALIDGDPARAVQHADAGLACAARLSWVTESIHRVALAEALWRAGHSEDALAQLADVRKAARGTLHTMLQAALLLEALIYRARGEPHPTDERLEEGFALGAGYRFVPLVGPGRDGLAVLCALGLKRGIGAAYARELVQKLSLDVEFAEASGASAPAPAKRVASVPRAFAGALREALRGLHEARKLARSPLLDSRMVAARAGTDAPAHQRVQALKDILCEAVRALGTSARSEIMYRALLHTYVDPSPSQVLAAEAARISFGTYRRHLAAATSELATALWLREQAAGGARAG